MWALDTDREQPIQITADVAIREVEVEATERSRHLFRDGQRARLLEAAASEIEAQALELRGY